MASGLDVSSAAELDNRRQRNGRSGVTGLKTKRIDGVADFGDWVDWERQLFEEEKWKALFRI